MEALSGAVDTTNTVASTSWQTATLRGEIRKAQTFLTNQSSTTNKLLSNLASLQTPPKKINKLTVL